ncbi:MAG: hypothetical protein IPF54_16040 [Draconibacterium sp.]|nr:hypothetical protein [Draconibacterium sp.]
MAINFLPQLLLAQYTKQYTYDKLNRLQQIKFNNAPVVSYIYDELGNRTAKTVNESGFTISPKQLVVAALANSKATFAINSSLAWSITSNQSWLSANTGSGNGNATITLTASANTGSDSRPALVIVSATGFKPDTVRVTQAGTTNLLTASPSALSLLSASESAAKFTVSSNIAWSVVCSESWLTLSQTSGFNNSEITVSANSANTGSTNRSATITVSGTGVSSQTITVTQAGSPFQPTLFLSANSVIFGPSNVSTATLTLTSNMNWTATSNESWLTLIQVRELGIVHLL